MARIITAQFRILKNLFLKIMSLVGLAQKEDVALTDEPRYWPEVQNFMKDLDRIIIRYTDPNPEMRRINERLLSYVEDQINQKGQIKDIEERHMALMTICDRILLNYPEKVSGLKELKKPDVEFSLAVSNFKTKLKQRKEHDLAAVNVNQGESSHGA